jgi:hypothetical protein
MGFRPADVDAMSLWQFAACVDGWNRAHGAKDGPGAMSDEDFAQALEAIDSTPAVMH